MSTVPPGWYKDPADPTTQRWWDGEGWLGDPIPADATPPPGPPPHAAPYAVPPVATSPITPAGVTPGVPAPGASPPAGPGGYGVTDPAGPVVGPTGVPLSWPVNHRYPMAVPRPHGFMVAGAGSRFMARLVDVLAVLVLAGLANVWFAIEFWRSFQPVLTWATQRPVVPEDFPPSGEHALTMMIVMGVVLTFVWFAYEVPASANSGQTLGKRIFGIRVVRLEADGRLGFGRSFRRWFRLAWPTPFWVACYGLPILVQLIDCVFVAFDRRLHQALHDRIALTVVVQLPRASRPETARIPIDTNPASTGHPSNPTDRL